MIREPCELAVAALRFARTTTRALLADLPPGRALQRAGADGPHPLWIAGHLAVSDQWIAKMIEPNAVWLPATYRTCFGHKSEPQDDAAVYPPFDEVIVAMEDARARLIELVGNASKPALARPLGEEGVGFAATPLQAVNQLAWHEGWHGGQLSLIRRQLGLAAVFP